MRTIKPRDTLSHRDDDDEGNNDVTLPSEQPSGNSEEVCLGSSDSNDCMGDTSADCELSGEFCRESNGTEDPPCNTNSAEEPPVQVESEKPKKGKKKASKTPKIIERKSYDLRGNYDKTVSRIVEREKEGTPEKTSEEDLGYNENITKGQKTQEKVTIHDGLNTGLIPTSWSQPPKSVADVESITDNNELRTLFQLESKSSTIIHFLSCS